MEETGIACRSLLLSEPLVPTVVVRRRATGIPTAHIARDAAAGSGSRVHKAISVSLHAGKINMESLWNLSDDQLALVGCFGALIVSFGLISGVYHLRRLTRHGQAATRAIVRPGGTPAEAAEDHSTERKAA